MRGVIPRMTSGLFVPNSRRIGAIVAQVTISEQERDELVITEHPVEQGSPINDHAYKRPSEVTIRAGWSSSKAGDLSANGNGVYAQLLSWQAALRPFDLYTGKRSYKSMLIQSLMVSTDNHSEYALMADIVCRQVIIVSTKVTQAATNSDPSNQADPASNATPTDNGAKQPRNVGTGSPQTPQDKDVPTHVEEQGMEDYKAPVAPANIAEQGMEDHTPEGDKVEATVIKNVDPFGVPDPSFKELHGQ
jgi:hypothetical protein